MTTANARRTVLVTGASSGIGLECARAFLARGDRVVAQYRTQADPVAALAGEYGTDRVVPVEADLATEEGCVAAVAAAPSLEVLVHSAGIWNDGAIRDLSRQVLEEMFRTNTFSSYYLAREAARAMGRGSIVFIGSTAGQRGEPGHSHYAATKGAIQSLTLSLAVELAPEVRVNLVSPGWVRTPMAEEELATIGPLIAGALPNRRVGEIADCAHAALFLASQASAHLVGQDLCVSGGALLVVPRGQIVARQT